MDQTVRNSGSFEYSHEHSNVPHKSGQTDIVWYTPIYNIPLRPDIYRLGTNVDSSTVLIFRWTEWYIREATKNHLSKLTAARSRRPDAC